MKAYIIGRGCVNDKTKAANYMPLAKEANEKFGGKYHVRGGKFEVIEGTHEFTRNVIVEFKSFEIAKNCFNSKEYQEARSYRINKADFNGIIIEGY